MDTKRVQPSVHSSIRSILAQLAGPQTTFDMGLKGIKVLRNEGFFSFYYKCRSFLARNRGYEKFIEKNLMTGDKIALCKKEIEHFAYRPIISIITPVHNPKPSWIRSAIESVIGQIYEGWELCIADASTDREVKSILERYSKKDARIRVRSLAENKGISANSNEALSMASGEYIAFLDHDDELAADALYEVVRYLQSNPGADMIYTDEDKIDAAGRRCEPFFKPEWSPDMFLSIMYTCHFGVYRKNIIDKIGGFRDGYDGSQDYDLVLRLMDETDRIHHIPRIMYHWRAVPGSTAVSIDMKKYACVNAKKALSDHLRRNGIRGEVLDGLWPGSYRVKRDLIGDPLVSIIIPTRDRVEVLKKCVDSIREKTDYGNYEIIIVDNDSSEGRTHDYFEELETRRNVKVLKYGKEYNFSSINNYAVDKANGDVIVFLNNDTEVISPGWLSAMLEHAQRPEVGAVGCKLLYPDNTVQHAGIILGLYGGKDGNRVAGHGHCRLPAGDIGYFGRASIIHNTSAVTAACMMMQKKVFREVGGFDENLAIAYNDVDLCLRLRQKGYLMVYTPYAVLYHHESLSRGYEDTREKVERLGKEARYMREKWGALIDSGDPYYNPNLTLSRDDFSIKI